MKRFHIVEDCQAIIRRRGVFQQVDAYHRGEFVYAKVGTGFVRLLGFPHTTAPDISWVELEDHSAIMGNHGRWPKPRWEGTQ